MAYIEPPKGNRVVWRDGPPPSIGWWPASITRTPTILRWWDGKTWSSCASSLDDRREAARCAAVRGNYVNEQIEWAQRWWV